MTDFAIATEDALSEAVAETLLHQAGGHRVTQCLRRNGFGYLKSKVRVFNQMAHTVMRVLLVTDPFGASPSNLAQKLLEPGRVEGVAGVNLPMLLRAITYREKGMEILLTRAIGGGRDGVFNMLDH